jgi:hypothetical protein
MVYPTLLLIPIFITTLVSYVTFNMCKVLADALDPKTHR